MIDIIYNSEEVGTEIIDNRGRNIVIRKYHLSPTELERTKNRWNEEVLSVDVALKEKAGSSFFNPYRKGVYFYQIQSLFLLGCNEWHNLTDVLKKLEEYTSSLKVNSLARKLYGYSTVWDQFIGKTSRDNANKCKDYIGRVQENFLLLQRLSKLHPYGYKLHQACGAIDIKRVDMDGFPNGLYFYRLSTYNTPEESFPIRDFSEFTFPKSETKYAHRRFVGTIITSKKVIKDGKIV